MEEKIILNGEWNYIKDEDSKLPIEEVMHLINSGKSFSQMEIPSNWQLKGLDSFNGTVWFTKDFTSDADILNNYKLKILHFNGVDYFADVWLNGEYLGSHEGYFQKFLFNLSNLKDKNILVVRVTSPFEESGKIWPLKKELIKGIFNHHDCRPGGWDLKRGQDRNTGGIWNDVFITFHENIFIKSVKVTSKINYVDNKAGLLITLKYLSASNFPLNDNISLEFIYPSGKHYKKDYKVLFESSANEILFSAELDAPELWWSWDLGNPSLYELKISGKYVNRQNIFFGIREVKLDADSNFYLNDRKLFLRGSNIIPEQFLSILTLDRIQAQVKLLREANINIVRMHAHVNRNEYYEECDRKGILIWQDFALQWTYSSSPEFTANVSRQIKEMVNQLYNHPSISFWCCHNEPGVQIATLDPFLYDAVLAEDNSRIVRLASNYEEHAYDGWYWGNKEHYCAAPMGPLVTEFGAQSLPVLSSLEKFLSKEDLYPPNWSKWKYHNFQYEQTFQIAGVDLGSSIDEFINNSQQYQAELIKTAVDYYRREKNKKISGVFHFMLIDCWESITWSIIDYFGEKKAGFYALKLAFQPLYVSINVRQKKYFEGSRLNIDIWVINDLYKSFSGCSILFKILNKNIGSFKVNSIEENSIQFYYTEKITIKLPELEPNVYKIEVELTNEQNEILSANNFQIEIEKKINL